jgi:hypothetical protein
MGNDPSCDCPTTSARRCSHLRVIEREASELESSRSALTERDSDQKARRQDRRHHRRDGSLTAGEPRSDQNVWRLGC